MNMGVIQYRHSNGGIVPRMFYSDANIDSLSVHQENGYIDLPPLSASISPVQYRHSNSSVANVLQRRQH
jgi:hypothetical protein